MSVELKLENSANADVRAILNNTILGTPGGIQYKQTNVNEKLDTIENTKFLCLNIRNRTIGTVSLTRRLFEHENLHPISADYIRFLSIKGLMRDENQHKSKKPQVSKRKNSIRTKIADYLNTSEDLKGADIPSSSDYLMYAFVDSHNERSANLVESFGFRSYRKFKTSAYNNFFAKKQEGVKRVEEGDSKKEIKRLLYKEYNGHSLYHPRLINLKKDYWVLEEDGQVIAGVKVRPTIWKIVNLPGIYGTLLQKILPRINFLSKHINPEAFRFLALEGIIVKDGYEEKFSKLLEGICYEYKTSIAMFWFDLGSPMLKRIDNIKKMGSLRKILKFKPANLYIRGEDLSKRTDKYLKETPTYISAYDVV